MRTSNCKWIENLETNKKKKKYKKVLMTNLLYIYGCPSLGLTDLHGCPFTYGPIIEPTPLLRCFFVVVIVVVVVVVVVVK